MSPHLGGNTQYVSKNLARLIVTFVVKILADTADIKHPSNAITGIQNI